MTLSITLYIVAACAYLVGNFVLYQFLKTELAGHRNPLRIFSNQPRIPGQSKRLMIVLASIIVTFLAVVAGRVAT